MLRVLVLLLFFGVLPVHGAVRVVGVIPASHSSVFDLDPGDPGGDVLILPADSGAVSVDVVLPRVDSFCGRDLGYTNGTFSFFPNSDGVFSWWYFPPENEHSSVLEWASYGLGLGAFLGFLSLLGFVLRRGLFPGGRSWGGE